MQGSIDDALGSLYQTAFGWPGAGAGILGRYTHQVAIFYERILGMDGNSVRFRVRDSVNGNRKKVMRLEQQSGICSSMQHE